MNNVNIPVNVAQLVRKVKKSLINKVAPGTEKRKMDDRVLGILRPYLRQLFLVMGTAIEEYYAKEKDYRKADEVHKKELRQGIATKGDVARMEVMGFEVEYFKNKSRMLKEIFWGHLCLEYPKAMEFAMEGVSAEIRSDWHLVLELKKETASSAQVDDEEDFFDDGDHR